MIETIYKHLDWDSNFFGFKIAQLLLINAESSQLKKVLNQLKSENYRLIYWPVDPKDQRSNEAAKKNQGLLVDRKTFYLLNFKKKEILNLSPYIETYKESYPNDELMNLAIQSGQYSRFKLDSHFPSNCFEALYLKWIENSVNKIFADIVYVYKNDNSIKGMITLSAGNQIGHIGLIAVDEKSRGMNIGYDLINAAKKYFGNKKITNIEVVTQEQNILACKFYEKLGFQKNRVINFYHFWLKHYVYPFQ